MLVVESIDRGRHFHPFGIAVCSNEKTEDFEFLFNSVGDGRAKMFEEDLSPTTLIADALTSIHQGFKRVFGHNSTIVMCWTVVKLTRKFFVFFNLHHGFHVVITLYASACCISVSKGGVL